MNNIWIEKYRPTNFDEILGQDKNINILKSMIDNNSLPHLLFHGMSGVGKTSTIISIANKLYGKHTAFMMIKLDASDDRGINTVRNEIKGFAEKKPLGNRGVKIVILDEVDNMTADAQFALRRIIEKYSEHTRFCLICNYENKIIPPIKSRCIDLRFYPIDKDTIYEKLKYICKEENIKYKKSGLQTIAELSNGDLRKSINILQSVSNMDDNINSDICYQSLGIPNNKIMLNIYNLLIGDSTLSNTYKYVKKHIINEGISLSLLLRELLKIFLDKKNNISDEKLSSYLIKMAQLEVDVSNSTFGDIYTMALICIFKS